MTNENKMFITATEMAEMLGISKGHAYKLIRELNGELKKEGYLRAFDGKFSLRDIYGNVAHSRVGN